MKSIRAAAMSSEDEAPAYTPGLPFKKDINTHSDYNYDDYNYSSEPFDRYKKEKEGTIRINLIISLKEIGRVADVNDDKFDWNEAIEKTQEIAIERVDQLLHKNYDNYETYYTVDINIIEGYDENEVEFKLTPKDE